MSFKGLIHELLEVPSTRPPVEHVYEEISSRRFV